MNPFKKLLNNSIIFTIGSIGSKLITILLVPLYTYQLSSEVYGKIDLISITASLIMPILSLSIYEATLRMSMEKDTDRSEILNVSLFMYLIGSFVLILISSFIFSFNIVDKNFVTFFTILTILQTLEITFSQFLRGIDKIKEFAFKGILSAVILTLSNILFIVKFNMGLSGYFISLILSNFVAILYMAVVCKNYLIINFRLINITLLKKMLIYSIPLIPNSILWWIMNASNRYMIGIFVGLSANGLFAIANKIPSIMQVFTNIFTQAWQISAIEESDSDKRDDFFSKTFQIYSTFLFFIVLIILLFLKLIFSYAIASEYYYAWTAAPFLLLSLVYSSFSGFLGTNYLVSKKTAGVMTTTVIGAIGNIFLGLIFIPTLGIIGASLSSLLSSVIVWLLRVFDTKKFIKIKYAYKIFLLNNFLIFISIGNIFLNDQFLFEFCINVILIFCFLLTNKNLLFDLIRKVSKT